MLQIFLLTHLEYIIFKKSENMFFEDLFQTINISRNFFKKYI